MQKAGGLGVGSGSVSCFRCGFGWPTATPIRATILLEECARCPFLGKRKVKWGTFSTKKVKTTMRIEGEDV
jgi:hypothetical protein